MWQKVFRYFLAVSLMLAVSCAFFWPYLDGQRITQTDIAQYQGMSQEIRLYEETTGRTPLWTDAMLGGSLPPTALGCRGEPPSPRCSTLSTGSAGGRNSSTWTSVLRSSVQFCLVLLPIIYCCMRSDIYQSCVLFHFCLWFWEQWFWLSAVNTCGVSFVLR